MTLNEESKESGDRWLTIKDLAERWKISERTVRRLLDSGKLPHPLRLGAALRFSPDAIAAYEKKSTKKY